MQETMAESFGIPTVPNDVHRDNFRGDPRRRIRSAYHADAVLRRAHVATPLREVHAVRLLARPVGPLAGTVGRRGALLE